MPGTVFRPGRAALRRRATPAHRATIEAIQRSVGSHTCRLLSDARWIFRDRVHGSGSRFSSTPGRPSSAVGGAGRVRPSHPVAGAPGAQAIRHGPGARVGGQHQRGVVGEPGVPGPQLGFGSSPRARSSRGTSVSAARVVLLDRVATPRAAGGPTRGLSRAATAFCPAWVEPWSPSRTIVPEAVLLEAPGRPTPAPSGTRRPGGGDGCRG